MHLNLQSVLGIDEKSGEMSSSPTFNGLSDLAGNDCGLLAIECIVIFLCV